jgi:hypothetical protein
VFHVFGSIAHFERRLIVERTRDGVAAARARGKVPGRPTLDTDKPTSALKLIEAGVRPAQAAWPILQSGHIWHTMRCCFFVGLPLEICKGSRGLWNRHSSYHHSVRDNYH